MLVHHLHEFIDNLSQTMAVDSHYDSHYLNCFKERYSSTDPDFVLSTPDMQWIELILAKRWQDVMDKLDYTFDSQNTNRLWVQLAKKIGNETGKPWINLLIPSITNDKDPDLHQDVSQITDPCDIFLSEDNKTWHSVKGIVRQLELDKRNLLTAKPDQELRPLTLKELWRIRSKKYTGEIFISNHSSFWSYLVNDIVPVWSQGDKLHPPLPDSLVTAIDIYLQTESLEKFDRAFSGFVIYLDTLPIAEQVCLYGITIEHDNKQIYLLDILLDCLMPDADLFNKLSSVSGWQQINHSSELINKPLSKTDSSRQIFKYFDILYLQGLLDELPIMISSSFAGKLENMQSKIIGSSQVGSPFVEAFKSLLMLPWSEIIDEQDQSSLLISKQYKSFWHYLIGKTAPHGQKSGQLSIHLFQDLLNIIDFYFQNSGENNLREILNLQLSVFISNIVTCPIEDANYFYSVMLEHNGSRMYLLEALLESFQQPNNRNEILKSVANLIYGIDPSLIGKSPELEPLYKQHHAGKFFDSGKLSLLLMSLEMNSEPTVSAKLFQLKEMVLKESSINEAIINKIIELYALAWEKFIDTPEDYFRPGGVVNKAWITLAQHLAGAGLIDTNYYKLLIPTLSHDTDCITLQKLTMHTLPNYILSEDGRELVFLRNSIEHHINNGTFYNCNYEIPKPFSPKEKSRIRHSCQEFADYIDYVEEKTEELAVYKKTIMKVYELVEGSVYPDGLSLGNDYTDTQMTSAELAYKNFLKFVETLPESERTNLYKQHILFHGKLVTFADVMKEILGKDACIAVWGQFFVKLIIDYDPYMKFSKELEIKADIDTLRLCSAKKVYRDYASITDAEAQRRLLIIFASLMTHSFKYVPFTGISLYVWDCINTVTLTGKEIFQLLENCLMVNHFEDARFVYASLMESIVKPALVEEGFLTSMVRYTDTRLWLQTIEDNSIFDPEKAIYFNPEVLVSVLWPYVKKNNRYKLAIEPLLDQIVITLAQNNNDHLKWLRINIKFSEFLSKLSDPFRNQLLGKLRRTNEPVNQVLVIENITDFVIHRLASQIARDPTKYYNFFKGKSSINSIVYSSFSRLLKTNMDSLKIGRDISIHDLLETILGAANHLIGAFESRLLTSYIEKLTSLFPVIIGNNQCSGNDPQVELIF